MNTSATFPDVLETVYSMSNSDINTVGEYLGYAWNQVCDEVRSVCCYAEDGDGAFTLYRESSGKYFESKILNDIFVAIFNHYKDAMKIQVIN